MNFKITRNKFPRVHFTGIGGISMSGLAEILIHEGFQVTGSDANPSKIIEKLQGKGAVVNIGHSAENVEGASLIVYTAAVKQDNIELVHARELNIPVISRAELLGAIMKNYQYGIAISGTHGKTTTTSLISIIFKNADFDPTIMVGGELDAIGGTVRTGKGPYFITEACEYVESFLKLNPYIGIILNVDADHLDYYRDINHIISSFRKFASLIPKEGYVIVSADDNNAMKAVSDAECNMITYGIERDADWTGKNICYDNSGFPSFDAYYRGNFFGSFKLNIPGRHNIYNALSSIACAQIFNINKDVIGESFLKFYGTHRRFEKKGVFNGVTVIDDYAHHPTEVKAALSAAKNYPHRKLYCIFQPHTYTRTIKLLSEFSNAFGDADELILADIYAAREKDTGDINSKVLSEKIAANGVDAKYLPSFEAIADYVRNKVVPGDVVITMGAGDVYKIGDMLLKL